MFCKFDLQGNLLFAKTVIVPNRTFGLWSPTLTGTADGNLIVGGYFSDIGINMFASLMKFTPNGDTIWSTEYPNPLVNGDFMRLDDMISTNDGGYLIGSTYINWSAQHHDLLLIKTDALGVVQWQNSYGHSSWNDGAIFIHRDKDSSIILSWGTANNNLGNPNPPISYSQTVWIDSIGSSIHTMTSDTSNSSIIGQGRDIIIIDNSYFLGSAFGTRNSGSILSNAFIYKLDHNRNFLWGKIIANHVPSNLSEIRHLFETNDDNILAVGTRSTNDSTYFMGYMQKVTPNGDSLWQRTYAALTTNSAWNEVYDAHPTLDGGYLICGESLSFFPSTEPLQQAWLLKVDSMGCRSRLSYYICRGGRGTRTLANQDLS